jgi:alpha-L-fucosidase
MHFGPNTFTDVEWGKGTESEKVFNPSQLDCRQWCRITKAAGAKGIIITAKHHDGFCLWPSKYSSHTVRESGWKDGKGDVLKELSAACREYGLKFGVYISPWDRNHPAYGTPEYNDVYINTMKEVFANYGPLFELWWDGANGEGPNGKKQIYDFKKFENVVREFSPHTVVFSDIGPDIRWVGNEDGVAGETNWNLLDTAGFGRGATSPPTDTLNRGNENGANWIPAECDVSIRPGWFYHAGQDTLVKTPEQLMRLYLLSVGRGSSLLLNVPPDTRGLIHEQDSAALMGFKKLRDKLVPRNLALGVKAVAIDNGKEIETPNLNDGDSRTCWAPEPGKNICTIELDLGGEKSFTTIQLQEGIEFGQRIKSFSLEVEQKAGWKRVASGTTIGYKRILQFPKATAQKIRLNILSSKATPMLSEIAIFSSHYYGDPPKGHRP